MTKRNFMMGGTIAALMLGASAFAAPQEGCPMMSAGMNEAKQPCPMMKAERGRMGRGMMGAPMKHQMDGREKFKGAGPEKMLMPRAPMNEDEMARFADLGAKLRYAMADFRNAPNDQNKAAVKSALTNLIDATRKFEVERCEKALARAQAKLAEKDDLVNRIFKRMTEPRPEKPEGKFAPEKPAPDKK